MEDILIWIITIIVVIVSVLGILLVLIQSSKGGAGGLFGDAGSSSIIGSDQRGDFFSRLTSILLGIFIVGSFGLAYLKYQSQTLSLENETPVIKSDKASEGEGKAEEIKTNLDAAKDDTTDTKTENPEAAKDSKAENVDNAIKAPIENKPAEVNNTPANNNPKPAAENPANNNQ